MWVWEQQSRNNFGLSHNNFQWLSWRTCASHFSTNKRFRPPWKNSSTRNYNRNHLIWSYDYNLIILVPRTRGQADLDSYQDLLCNRPWVLWMLFHIVGQGGYMSTKLRDSLECLLVISCPVKLVNGKLQQQWPNKGKATKGSDVSVTPLGKQ